MKLIDKSALVAEIERLRKNQRLDDRHGQGVLDGLHAIEKFLDNLEVKEINFKDVKSVFEGQYLSKDKVVTTIERLQDECEEQGDNNGMELLEKLFNKLDTLEVKEVNEVPATVMVNKYGLRFISSWPGLKEYDDLKEGEEIKILIPKK